MDDALVRVGICHKDENGEVLILVVMDDALVHDEDTQFRSMLAES